MRSRASAQFARAVAVGYDRRAMSTSMVTAIEAFRKYLVSEKRASAHTVRAYLHDVQELAAFARAARGRGPDERSAADHRA